MIPVIMQVKSQDELLAVERLPKLKKDHALYDLYPYIVYPTHKLPPK
jgi:hypothetical protein